jgi:hypothetical protein
MVEQSGTNSVLNLRDGIAKLLGYCLTFQGFDGVRVSGSGHNDKSDDGDVGSCFLQAII